VPLHVRPWVLALALYGVLALVVASPGLVPGRTMSSSDALWASAPWTPLRPPGVRAFGANRELSDQVRAFEPFLQHTRATLPHIPLWDPAISGGRPFLGNGQSAVFSPFSLPAYTLPFWSSLAVIAALKLLVAALGSYGLGRALGMRPGGALLTGLVYGFSLWMVAWVSWPTTSTWALMPWLWLLADRLVRRPSALAVAGLAAAIGLQFLGGHPESSFHVVAATCCFLALRLLALRPPRGGRGRWATRRVAAFAGAGALGGALAALTLLPLVELIAHSGDVSARSAFGGTHTPARYLLGLFLHDWWGRPTRTSLELGRLLAGHALYVGALPLMLVGAALVRPRAERVGIAVLGAAALAISLGAPPLFELVTALPGFDVSQNARLVVVFVLCMAVLAGWGLDDLTGEAPAATGRRLVAGVALAVVVAPVVWVLAAGDRPPLSLLGEGLRVAWGFADPPAPGVAFGSFARTAAIVHWQSLLEWLVLAVAAGVLLALRLTGRLGATAFATAAVALVAADLLKAGIGLNPAIPKAHAVQPVTPALRVLQERRPNRFAGLAPTAPFSVAGPIPPDVALRYGLKDARGYDFPVEDRYLRLWRSQVAPGCSLLFCTTGASATPRSLRVLSLLSAADLLQQPRDAVLRLPSLRVVYDGPDGRIYRNTDALPRAFVAERQVVVDGGDAALRAVTAPGFAPRGAVVTEHRLPGVPAISPAGTASAGGGAGAGAGAARIERDDPERVVIDAATDRPGILVLTDVAYPGWRATVDGRGTPVARVDFLLRGIALPPGRHHVELRYRPLSWRVGWITSSVALVVLLALVAVGTRRRRVVPRPPPP
jgi:hypothetical protein